MTENSGSEDAYYRDFYTSILDDDSRTFLGRMVRLTHITLERALTVDANYEVVLELGAGHGQHFPYVKHKFNQYIESDIRPNHLLSAEIDNTSRRKRILLDAQDLKNVRDSSIDRIIATCVLVHLPNPFLALQEWRRVIKKNRGLISLYIPCEPGLILRICRYLTTVQKAKRMGVDHLLFHYKEHKFHYLYLKAIIGEVFADCDVRFKSYPFMIGSWNFNLWTVCTIHFSNSSKTCT